MTTPRPPLVTIALASAVLALAACGDDDGSDGGGGDVQVVGTTVAGAVEVEVEARDFEFVPSPLELPAGEPVNLTMRVTSGGHNLRIEGVGFQLPIVDEPGAAVGTVTIPSPGEYRLVCTVPGHEAAGMVGTVTAR